MVRHSPDIDSLKWCLSGFQVAPLADQYNVRVYTRLTHWHVLEEEEEEQEEKEWVAQRNIGKQHISLTLEETCDSEPYCHERILRTLSSCYNSRGNIVVENAEIVWLKNKG